MSTRRELLQELDKIDFPQQMTRYNIKRGGIEPTGFVLGKVRNRGSGLKFDKRVIRDSKRTHTPKYKDVYKLAVKLMREHDPKFRFSSIQVNKNNRTAKHIDGNNVGFSYITGLGDYTGGALKVYDEEGRKPRYYNLKNKWAYFNGSQRPHETEPFTGDRYTLVYYDLTKGVEHLLKE